jgi:hypothetical protein|tara:strand:+ start:240 stop:461 length:222 start_codon:yes stop_codon:yes gene_type:complete
MGCDCKNKENHACQNGGKCECGGKCKKDDYLNAVGSLEDFKNEENNTGKAVIQLSAGIILAIVSLMLYNIIKN